MDRLQRMTIQPTIAARNATGRIAQPHGKPESEVGAGGVGSGERHRRCRRLIWRAPNHHSQGEEGHCLSITDCSRPPEVQAVSTSCVPLRPLQRG
ncbi:MAG: hypothetical protein WBB69_12390 [Anaerolineales bacterium]